MDFHYNKAGTIFNMHSYWTKQPVEPIEYFINKFSKPGETILDPFCGSGMTGVAAIKTHRNTIINDLSPLCIHISKGYCTNFHVEDNKSRIDIEQNRIIKDLTEYYLTKCKKCRLLVPISFSIVGEVWQSSDGKEIEKRGEMMLKNDSGVNFNKANIFKEFNLISLCYKCKCTSGKQYKNPDEEDLRKFEVNDFLNYFYPKDDFWGQEPRRNFKRGIKKVYQMYSRRNLTVLSILFSRIQKIKDENMKQLFLFTFTSILFNSSLMSRYRNYENTSIKMGTFYIPPLIKDTNVVDSFQHKLKTIIKGNALIFSNNNSPHVEFLTESADKLEEIKKNTIDYIYTDPPYSDILSYSELNIIYESWLGIKTDPTEEMIVSKFQKKDIDDYASRFEMFLKRSYKLLKDGKILTLVFHHPNISHWSTLQESIQNSGFEPIVEKKPIRLISNSKTASQHKTKKNTQCFLIFNFKKNPNYKGLKLTNLDDTEYKNLINQVTLEGKKLGYIEKSDLFDFIINKLLFNVVIKDFTV